MQPALFPGFELDESAVSGSRLSVHFSSGSLEWETPDAVFESLNEIYQFTIDACAGPETAKCPRFYAPGDDGLIQDWGSERVWVNPPYGREIGRWIRKGYESARAGALVVMLIPSRTDTKWWHSYVMRGHVVFLKGRLRFSESASDAPFPSAIVVFLPNLGQVPLPVFPVPLSHMKNTPTPASAESSSDEAQEESSAQAYRRRFEKATAWMRICSYKVVATSVLESTIADLSDIAAKCPAMRDEVDQVLAQLTQDRKRREADIMEVG